MVHRRLQENPVRIDWDGLGQFRSLNVPLLFPQVVEISTGPMVPMFHLVWNSSFSNTQKITLSARRHRSPLNVLRMAHILNPWRFRFPDFYTWDLIDFMEVATHEERCHPVQRV